MKTFTTRRESISRDAFVVNETRARKLLSLQPFPTSASQIRLSIPENYDCTKCRGESRAIYPLAMLLNSAFFSRAAEAEKGEKCR